MSPAGRGGFRHGVDAFFVEAVCAIDMQVDVRIANRVEREGGIEEPDEGADATAAAAVFGDAEQEGGEAFEVTVIHVIAERCADDFAAGVHDGDELGLGVRPFRIGVEAGFRAVTD